MRYRIREIRPDEYPLLDDFLYEAIFQRDENSLLPREITQQPSLRRYIEDFGKEHDHCLVAETEEGIVGAVWVRTISGFGYIDQAVPEFAISLYKQYRGLGIGTDLMIKMLALLESKGYQSASLAVQKDNYALKMYLKVGFKIYQETDQEYIMVCDLQRSIEK